MINSIGGTRAAQHMACSLNGVLIKTLLSFYRKVGGSNPAFFIK